MIKRIRQLAQLVSFRELRNAALGLFVVFGGLALALLTLYAHRTGNIQLAGISAAASLVFVLLIIVFVIPPLARSASAEASQMNLPFEFTTGGAVFVVVVAIVAFAAWNTGNNLLFLVLSFISAALLVSFVLGSLCLKRLDVKMRFPETIFAGESTPILVGLTNRKRIFPTYSVTAEVRGKERKYSKLIGEFKKIISEKWAKRIARPPVVKHTLDYFVFIPRRGSIETKVEHSFPYRGRFIIQDFELSTKFPFGFFRHRRRLPAQKAEIVVFPKLQRLKREVLDFPLNAGKLVSSSRGMGQDLFALRDYQPTDDIRHIDWKATARSSKLTVREYTAEDDKRITVILDPHILPAKEEQKKTLRQRISEEHSGRKLSPAEERFEKGVSKAASLLSHFESELADTRAILGSEKGEFGSGKAHLAESFRKLALIEPDYEEYDASGYLEEALSDTYEDHLNGHVFLVTTLNETEIPPRILRRMNLVSY